LFLMHPQRPWFLDLGCAGLAEGAIDALPWARAFDEMEQLEAGAVANPDEGRQVGHYWLRDALRAPTVGQARAIGDSIEGVRTFCERVRSGAITAEDGLPFTDVVHIGIGGSALGPQLLVDALGDLPADEPEPGPRLRLHFLDNTDPDGIARVLDGLGDRLRHALVVVVSKSGSTAETHNGMVLTRHAVTSRGFDWASRAVAVTGDGSVLHRLATSERWLATFPLWDWVGGRTSVTAAVGLLPGGLAGVDTAALLEGAREMDEWTRIPRWSENPAAMLAGAWHALGNGRGDRHMVVLPYADRLVTMSRYLQQLVMESLGKRLDREGNVVEQGLTVYGNKGSTDQHAYVQQLRDGRDDFFVQFVQVLSDGRGSAAPVDDQGASAGDWLQGFLLGTRRALHERGRPSLTITIERVDAWNVGALVALFERAVGLYASLVGINAYHQPGVEAGKTAARDVLALRRRLLEAVGREPRDAGEIAGRVQADPVEVLYLLERLAETGRVTRGAGRTYARR